MKQYPIWIDTHNPSYANQFSKSMGVKYNTDATSDIKIGTSKVNSFDFLTTVVKTFEANGVKMYQFSIDGDVVREARYDAKTSIMKMFLVKNGIYTEYFTNEKKAVA